MPSPSRAAPSGAQPTLSPMPTTTNGRRSGDVPAWASTPASLRAVDAAGRWATSARRRRRPIARAAARAASATRWVSSCGCVGHVAEQQDRPAGWRPAARPIAGRAGPARRSGGRRASTVRSARPARAGGEQIGVGAAGLGDHRDVPPRRPAHGWSSPVRCGRTSPARRHGELAIQPETAIIGCVLKKILIANRGEIAVRVIRAARELGIATVAVYSELDRNALHVRLADEAYALGGQTAAESYLNTEAILDAIEQSGADGVHPGYGFFSENADFARAITELGRRVHRPARRRRSTRWATRSAAARPRSRAAHRSCRAPPSSPPAPTRSPPSATSNGWPVAIKAAFGGGGRGMKVVQSAAEVQDAMDSAQREAKAFFGRDEIYVERYLTWPRHVEVQIVGDQHGNVVWVSTRDCSAQRRHQKLIEEAPATALPDGVEEAMGEAAIKAAKAVGYYNAGTVEFIYQDGEFFFLEMNTRLQVEHPVTEVITGIDLVEWQIRVASGEPLPMTQDEVAARRHGHGIEIRINAENPAGGKFLPSPGTITKLHRARRVRRALRRRLRDRRRDQPVLRQPRRQAHRVGQGPPDGDRAHDPGARGDGRRGRRHHDPRRPRDPRSTPTSRRCSTRRSGSRRRST